MTLAVFRLLVQFLSDISIASLIINARYFKCAPNFEVISVNIILFPNAYLFTAYVRLKKVWRSYFSAFFLGAMLKTSLFERFKFVLIKHH